MRFICSVRGNLSTSPLAKAQRRLPGAFTPLRRRNCLILLPTMRAVLTVQELTHINIKKIDLARAMFAATAARSDLPLFQPESPHWQATQARPT